MIKFNKLREYLARIYYESDGLKSVRLREIGRVTALIREQELGTFVRGVPGTELFIDPGVRAMIPAV